jgi:hypothetical protein
MIITILIILTCQLWLLWCRRIPLPNSLPASLCVPEPQRNCSADNVLKLLKKYSILRVMAVSEGREKVISLLAGKCWLHRNRAK